MLAEASQQALPISTAAADRWSRAAVKGHPPPGHRACQGQRRGHKSARRQL